MTLTELKQRTTVERIGNCKYKVTIKYRGKEYSCISRNSIAWDCLGDKDYHEEDIDNSCYTNKGAYQSFYNECKLKNGLGRYVCGYGGYC